MKSDIPLVVVEWNDAWTSEVPATLDGHLVHKPERITTIGWLLREDEQGVQLANEFYDGTYRGRTFVPKAMVVKIRRVKLTTLTKEFFMPGFLERDEGEREPPYEKYPWDGVSGVRPFHGFAATTTVGVY